MGSRMSGSPSQGRPSAIAAITAIEESHPGPQRGGSPNVVTGSVDDRNRYPDPTVPITAQHAARARHDGRSASARLTTC